MKNDLKINYLRFLVKFLAQISEAIITRVQSGSENFILVNEFYKQLSSLQAQCDASCQGRLQ